MDPEYVHSYACLIKKPNRDYGAEFDALKDETEKYMKLKEKTRSTGLFGRQSFDDVARQNWIREQEQRDQRVWEDQERVARAKKTKEDTAELLVLQLKLVKV